MATSTSALPSPSLPSYIRDGCLYFSITKKQDLDDIEEKIKSLEVRDQFLIQIRKIDVCHDVEDDDVGSGEDSIDDDASNVSIEKQAEVPTSSIEAEKAHSSSTSQFDRAISLLTKILELKALTDPTSSAAITSFTYDGPAVDYEHDCSLYTGHTRPLSFWTSLAEISPGLRHLHLKLYSHELLRLERDHDQSQKQFQATSLPSSVAVKIRRFPEFDFPALKTLTIDLTGAHGDSARLIDEHILQTSLPQLETLRLRIPSCSFPSCRVSDLTYDKYSCPSLKELVFSGCYDDESEVKLWEFLGRCPLITRAHIDAEGDEVHIFDESEDGEGEEIGSALSQVKTDAAGARRRDMKQVMASSLPYLEFLELGDASLQERSDSSDWFSVFVSSSIARRPISHLNIGRLPHNRYADIKNLAPTLRELHLSIDALSLRSGKTEHQVRNDGQIYHIHSLLQGLPFLRTLTLRFTTGSTFIWPTKSTASESLGSKSIPPLDIHDLVRVFQNLIPSDSVVENLAMIDNNPLGKGLDNDESLRFLKAPEEIAFPKTLKHLEWRFEDHKGSGILFQKVGDSQAQRALEEASVEEDDGQAEEDDEERIERPAAEIWEFVTTDEEGRGVNATIVK